MRVRSVNYFISQLGSKNSKFQGPKNQEEITNQELAEYFAEKNKKNRKVAA
jgi:hypothetical protein